MLLGEKFLAQPSRASAIYSYRWLVELAVVEYFKRPLFILPAARWMHFNDVIILRKYVRSPSSCLFLASLPISVCSPHFSLPGKIIPIRGIFARRCNEYFSENAVANRQDQLVEDFYSCVRETGSRAGNGMKILTLIASGMCTHSRWYSLSGGHLLLSR